MKKIRIVMIAIVALLVMISEFASANPRKKWSHRKKGTVIGAAAGAGVGALVSRHKGRGALIGAAAGGAVGYLHGRHKDKKEGKL